MGQLSTTTRGRARRPETLLKTQRTLRLTLSLGVALTVAPAKRESSRKALAKAVLAMS